MKDITASVTPAMVALMFPKATPRRNIEAHLPRVLAALHEIGLGDADMVCMALATIRAETEGFAPISEGVSRFNTAPGGPHFGLYDHRTDIGNNGYGQGAMYRGRGFVQLTGRANYDRIGREIGVDLVRQPDLANDPVIAARILAQFLKDHEARIRSAIAAEDGEAARRAVNGGTHGIDAFLDAWNRGQEVLPG